MFELVWVSPSEDVLGIWKHWKVDVGNWRNTLYIYIRRILCLVALMKQIYVNGMGPSAIQKRKFNYFRLHKVPPHFPFSFWMPISPMSWSRALEAVKIYPGYPLKATEVIQTFTWQDGSVETIIKRRIVMVSRNVNRLHFETAPTYLPIIAICP